ncbi:MAG: adenylate/guanylate cyclase domain-containing protein [Verrucomicrobiota bacterium]
MLRLKKKHLTRVLTIVAGCLLALLLGLACLHYSFAEPLARLSYDLPFVWRSSLDTSEAVLVYLDDDSVKQLQQSLNEPLSRSLHAQLLDRLTQDHARLIFYDIGFDSPATNEGDDTAFADAIRRNGRVVLGALLDTGDPTSSVRQERILPPTKLLRKAAAGWGLLTFRPLDADYGVRQIFTGTAEIPASTWKAAEILDAPVTHNARQTTTPRWINYYGPATTFSSVNFAQALNPEGVSPGYFTNKIVMIGGRSAAGRVGSERDEFATPYSRSHHAFTPGVEIHATVLLNLLHGDWLTRLPIAWETILIVLVALLAGALAAVRPVYAVLVAFAAFVVIACSACWLAWQQRIWFDWLTPAAVQIPLGLAWSVGAQYVLESRRRKELRSAFGFYLSPHMADKIAESDFDLKPGGKIVEATVLFTDLESFTSISEKLDPTEVSQLLIAYFEQTTRCILENKGTILKYVGDAVIAAWGAPVDEPAHATRGVEAACDLRCLAELDVHGKKLRTRIGVHSGKVLAGNLGSSYRFDYTMIGDAVNFASRLESLNKYLSTQVLISDAVRAQVGDKFITRRLGEFRVAGKTQAVVIHELLCRDEQLSNERTWIKPFEEGLSVFRSGDFEKARTLMNETRQLRGGSDGPAEFYLRKIEKLQADGAVENWTGIVELSEK